MTLSENEYNGLTDGEITAVKGILKEIDYAEIVEQSEATSGTTSSGDDFEPIAHLILGGDR